MKISLFAENKNIFELAKALRENIAQGSFSIEEPLQKNFWKFFFFGPRLQEDFQTVEKLYAALLDLKRHIAETTEYFRERAFSFSALSVQQNEESGISGSYILIDSRGRRRFFVKPLDEEAGCIHSQRFSSPLSACPFRRGIDLYQSCMREVLASMMAKKLGVGNIVPKTVLGIIESDVFFDLENNIDPKELVRYLQYFPERQKEKLCSVQEYVEEGISLFEALHQMIENGLSDEQIERSFDQDDFENTHLLLWTIFDTDAHMGNFLVYPKGVDSVGNEILGIKKIDNGLAFPEKNVGFQSGLTFLPNAKKALSERMKRKILSLEAKDFEKDFLKLGLEGSFDSLETRISILKTLIEKKGITLREISEHFVNIGKKS